MDNRQPDFKRIYKLAKYYIEASEILEAQSKKGDWGCSAPRLLVDSFAVELLLKCIIAMDHNKFPSKEHDWTILFNELRPETKKMIREEFERSIQSNPVLSRLDTLNPAAKKTTDFNRALKAASKTFANRRYLYENQTEEQKKSEWFYTFLLRDAIHKVTKMDLRLCSTESHESAANTDRF